MVPLGIIPERVLLIPSALYHSLYLCDPKQELRKPISERYQVTRDSLAPSYFRLVGKKMGEMYSEGGFCPCSSDRECNRMSTLLLLSNAH